MGFGYLYVDNISIFWNSKGIFLESSVRIEVFINSDKLDLNTHLLIVNDKDAHELLAEAKAYQN